MLRNPKWVHAYVCVCVCVCVSLSLKYNDMLLAKRIRSHNLKGLYANFTKFDHKLHHKEGASLDHGPKV